MPSDPQDWLDQMWHAGYCDATVRRCSETALNSGGSKQRLAWMQEHTPGCVDCLYANFWKNQEAAVADSLGFLEEFMNGGDVTKRPGFKDQLAARIHEKIASGVIDDDITAWMDRVVQRRDKPWPGRVQ